MIIASPIALAVAAGVALTLATPTLASENHHIILEPDAMEWEPVPAAYAEGAEEVLLYGDPGAEGRWALRMRMPDGYHIAPHTHGSHEVVTVLSGTLWLGTGEQADRDAATRLPEGSFFVLEPRMAHYVYADGETVIQVDGLGPSGIEYVNPEDDPRAN